MIEFNDSNADVTRNGVSIFFEPVDIDDDVFISSSCIFMDDFHTTGSLKAQYSLTVHGSLSVDGDLKIGEDLTCISILGGMQILATFSRKMSLHTAMFMLVKELIYRAIWK